MRACITPQERHNRRRKMEIAINNEKLLFIRVSRTEAVRLIRSLSEQILANNPNVGRDETYATNGIDVSIAVMPEPVGLAKP